METLTLVQDCCESLFYQISSPFSIIFRIGSKHFFGIWIASTIYDNRAIFLSCDELPDLSDVKSVMEQHNQVIEEIKNIDPENIEITIDNSCPGKGSLIIYYPSHNDRTQIEELLGDSFFGIPWKGINR